MSAPDLTVEWYYVTAGGDQLGPVTIDEFRAAYQSKATHGECLCWNESMTGWTLVKEVALLQSYFTPVVTKGPPSLPVTKKVPTIAIALPTLTSQSAAAEVVPNNSEKYGTTKGTGALRKKDIKTTTGKYKTLRKIKMDANYDASNDSSAPGASRAGPLIAKYKTLKPKRSTVNATMIQSVYAAITTSQSPPPQSQAQSVARPESPRSSSSVVNNHSNGRVTISTSENSLSLQPPSPRSILNSTSQSSLNATGSYNSSMISYQSSQSLQHESIVHHSPSQSIDLSSVTDAIPNINVASSVPVPTAVTTHMDNEIATELANAIHQYDVDALQYWLAAGDAINLDENVYVVSPLARMYLARITEARTQMREAVSSMDECKLIQAVHYSDTIGYDKIDVQSCRKLRDAVIQVIVEAKQQLQLLQEPKMKSIISRAEQLGLINPIVEQIRTLLSPSFEEKLRQLQLKSANKFGDKHRAIRLTIALKDVVFKTKGSMFTVDSYPKWRNTDEYASSGGLFSSSKELAESMKKFTSVPIPTSLTCIKDKELVKTAVKLNKRLLCCTGDRPSTKHSPQQCLTEILQTGLSEPLVRDEIYLQCMRQLIGNPGNDSEKRSWQVLYCCLETFPPQREMENILEMFLKKHLINGSIAVKMLHGTLYEGERRCVPSESELNIIQTGKSIRHCSFAEECEYQCEKSVLPSRAPLQLLAGTSAETIHQFLASGQQPDWQSIDVAVPTLEQIQQQQNERQKPVVSFESIVMKTTPSMALQTLGGSGRILTVNVNDSGSGSGFVSPMFPASPNGTHDMHGFRSVAAGFGTVKGTSRITSAAHSRHNSNIPNINTLRLETERSFSNTHSRTHSRHASSTTALNLNGLSSSSPPVTPRTPASATASSLTVIPVLGASGEIDQPPPMLSGRPAPLTPTSQTTQSQSTPVSPSAASLAPPAYARDPCEWGRALDPSTSQHYYYHLKTHEVTWDRPADYWE